MRAQQPSTTNQNATQGIYKGYKLARKSLLAYSIKMQYENVFKVIGVVHVILAFLKVLLLLKLLRRWLLVLPQVDQRLLTNTWPKTIHNINIHANNSKN